MSLIVDVIHIFNHHSAYTDDGLDFHCIELFWGTGEYGGRDCEKGSGRVRGGEGGYIESQ